MIGLLGTGNSPKSFFWVAGHGLSVVPQTVLDHCCPHESQNVQTKSSFNVVISYNH